MGRNAAWQRCEEIRIVTWPALKTGPYTRAQPVDAPVDAYLRWADATRFEHYVRPERFTGTSVPASVSVLIELEQASQLGELKAKGEAPLSLRGEDVLVGSRFFAATAKTWFFDALHAGQLKGIVRRVEMGMPVIPSRPARPHASVAPASPQNEPVQEQKLRDRTELLIAVIDDGCAFAHTSFRRDDGSTRVVALWDQDERPAFGVSPACGTVPLGFDYGREVSGAELDAVMSVHGGVDGILDETACYAAINDRALHRRLAHGPHVLDLIAGPTLPGARTELHASHPPSWSRMEDAATKADIVFVQLPRAALQDTSGGWLGVHVVDALRYILARAGTSTHIVVNLSYGSSAGPHDGTSLVECAMQDLVRSAAATGVRLDIVLPAGNAFESRCRAHVELASWSKQTLHWRVLPGSETPSFMQVWLPSGAAAVSVCVAPPERPEAEASGPIKVGEAVCWPSPEAPQCSVVYGRSVVHGEDGTMILLALAPTSRFGAGAAVAPHGIWSVELSNESNVPVQLDAYIARNDSDLGMQNAGRQSFLVDPAWDSERYLRAATDDNHPDAMVLRRGTLNGIATGEGVTVVAGYRFSDDTHARYSSAGPGRGSRPRRPDVTAVSEERPSLHGVRAAGTRSGATARLVGTSFAAPQVARALANRREVGVSARSRASASSQSAVDWDSGLQQAMTADLMGEAKLEFRDPGISPAPMSKRTTSVEAEPD